MQTYEITHFLAGKERMLEGKKQILSVGIDIGTSTLQLAISSLIVENTAPAWVIPHLMISEKEVLYKSDIYFTPMKNEKMLDLIQIRKIIEHEYRESGVNREKIETGAIIITGESANKENADVAAMELSEFAGDFVVAVAGPDLESILAGYGSGAAGLSEEKKTRIMNFDIGGGTTNTSVFDNGKVIDSWGMHIGGRLIRLNGEGDVQYCSEKLNVFLEENQIVIQPGDKVDFGKIKQVCRKLAQTLADVAEQKESSIGQESLQIYHAPKDVHAQSYSFSGGVGEYVYKKNNGNFLEHFTIFGDIGPLLGFEIQKEFKRRNLKIQDIPEKMRATVIGAGSHSMQLSGSTVTYNDQILPIKNIPVVRIRDDWDENILAEMMRKAVASYDNNVAFAFKGVHSPSYSYIKKMASEIWRFYEANNDPILIILEEDMAKVLGQTIHIKANGRRQIICLDGISAKDGDYVDFCKTISDSMLVVIKTLIFKN